MSRFVPSIGLAICVLLLGCDEAAMLKRHAPLQDEPVARKYLDLLMAGKVDELQKDLDSTVVDLDPHAQLQQLADDLPAEVSSSVKIVGAHARESGGVSKRDFTYECKFQGVWYVVGVDLQKKDNRWTILGVHGQRLADSLENLNRFTFVDKGLNQYVTLILALGSLLLSLYALRVCIRTKVGPTRWMWASFVLVGVGELSVNWTTGQILFQPFAIHVPCASADAAPYGPWIIGLSLPLGALIFLNEQWVSKVRGEPDSDVEVRAALDSLRRK